MFLVEMEDGGRLLSECTLFLYMSISHYLQYKGIFCILRYSKSKFNLRGSSLDHLHSQTYPT